LSGALFLRRVLLCCIRMPFLLKNMFGFLRTYRSSSSLPLHHGINIRIEILLNEVSNLFGQNLINISHRINTINFFMHNKMLVTCLLNVDFMRSVTLVVLWRSTSLSFCVMRSKVQVVLLTLTYTYLAAGSNVKCKLM
jgi:hypothetical protein